MYPIGALLSKSFPNNNRSLLTLIAGDVLTRDTNGTIKVKIVSLHNHNCVGHSLTKASSSPQRQSKETLRFHEIPLG